MHAFDVLGDPVRRRILELLADGEMSAGAIGATIQDEFAITQPAVSQHLKVLRDGCTRWTVPDCAMSTSGWPGSAASGRRILTRWPPKSHGENGNDEGRQHD